MIFFLSPEKSLQKTPAVQNLPATSKVSASRCRHYVAEVSKTVRSGVNR